VAFSATSQSSPDRNVPKIVSPTWRNWAFIHPESTVAVDGHKKPKTRIRQSNYRMVTFRVSYRAEIPERSMENYGA
jgi:hypothetical protein